MADPLTCSECILHSRESLTNNKRYEAMKTRTYSLGQQKIMRHTLPQLEKGPPGNSGKLSPKCMYNDSLLR